MNLTPPTDPLAQGLQRLIADKGFVRVDAGSADTFGATDDASVLLLTDELVRSPETWDMIVVLPEALKAVGPLAHAGVADPEASRSIAARFGISRFPALVLQRGGDYLGSIEGMRDWQPLVQSLRELALAPASRRPGIGIAVRSADTPACRP